MKILLLIAGVALVSCISQPGWNIDRIPLAVIGAILLMVREKLCK